MWYERCNNRRCRRPYQVNEFGGKPRGLVVAEQITCPHCGHQETRWSESVFLVHALSAEEEARYNEKYPLRKSPPTRSA